MATATLKGYCDSQLLIIKEGFLALLEMTR